MTVEDLFLTCIIIFTIIIVFLIFLAVCLLGFYTLYKMAGGI